MKTQSSVWFRLEMGNLIARLLLCLAVPVVGSLGCPNHCLCYTWRGLARTDCVHRNLFNTFVGFSHHTQVLDLSHNVITILHGNEFLDANLRQLQDLKLSHNELHKVDKLSFNGLTLLQDLDLSHNSIEYFNPFTFKYNPNLKTLNVSFNPLALPKDTSFLLAPQSLQVLDIGNCRFESVGPRSFGDLKRLAFLNMSQNIIRKIEPGFLEEMKSLKYLDLSKNLLPCNDQTNAFLQSLRRLKIQFRSFCDRSERMVMLPVVEAMETNQLETELQGMDNSQNTTPEISQSVDTVFNEIVRFFRSIPAFYAVICGIHVGVLIGSFSTYFCMRKTMRNLKANADLERSDQERRGSESDNVNFALIPLNTPPGTPPSPYHSRFFSSNFSLTATLDAEELRAVCRN